MAGATGTVPDILARLRTLLPPWFPAQGSAPIVDAVLTGIATLMSNIYLIAVYAYAQIRVASATDAFLDLIAWDYYGPLLKRYTDDTDNSFRVRILAFLLMPRITRAGIVAMLTALTGRKPGILALWNPQDCGGWDGATMGWDSAGCWGTLLPNQLTIVAYRPFGHPGIPPQAGWADGDPIDLGDELFGALGQFALGQLRTVFYPVPGAWDDGTGTVGGAISWVSPGSILGDVPDSLIQQYVAAWVAAGINDILYISN
jgi:hypothetical protein